MRSFLARLSSGFVVVGLNEDEPGWIIGLLNHIEPGNARFLNAMPRIFDRRLAKFLDTLRPDMDVNVDDEHRGTFDVNGFGSKRKAKLTTTSPELMRSKANGLFPPEVALELPSLSTLGNIGKAG